MIVEGLAFRGERGRQFQAATVGLELRLGADRQIPVFAGGGLYREPSDNVCVDVCEQRTFAPSARAALALGGGYLFRVAERLELGPMLAATFGGPYRSLRAGARLAYSL